MRVIDLTGKKVGRLTVAEFHGRRGKKRIWRCECSCGGEARVSTDKLVKGTTSSCGCLRVEYISALRLTHGHARAEHHTLVYYRWQGMIRRCIDPNHVGFKNYGGRGITVCERWRVSFQDFLSDMGMPPTGYVLDRRDNNGNYEPSNCHWVTASESARNTRRSPKYKNL